LHGFSGPLDLKYFLGGGQNRRRSGAILTPHEVVFPSGILTSVPILEKIDQEMRPWECSQTDRHTQTNGQTQTDFITCPMLYAVWQITKQKEKKY